MKITRRKSRVVKIGGVSLGGGNPVAIQSMVKVATRDAAAVIKQIKELQDCGCDLVRVAVKDSADALAIKDIKRGIRLPLIADIHFDWRLAIQAMNSGADKIRLNPGNIYKREQVREVVSAARLNRVPIRVGLNSGSLPKTPGRKRSAADIMVKGALDYLKMMEGFGFRDIVVSLKASNILDTVEAYRKIAGLCDYPLHLGVTATGLPRQGLIKSAIAVGSLLLEGIGDTIRISLTDSPQEEVRAAASILQALGLRAWGPEIISCPTCGRCEVDLIKIVKGLEDKLKTNNYRLITRPVKVAVMGCVVNGPGEAKEADIGVAFGKKDCLLFKSGKPVKKLAANECVEVMAREINGVSKCSGQKPLYRH